MAPHAVFLIMFSLLGFQSLFGRPLTPNACPEVSGGLMRIFRLRQLARAVVASLLGRRLALGTAEVWDVRTSLRNLKGCDRNGAVAFSGLVA